LPIVWLAHLDDRKFFRGSGDDGLPASIESIEKATAAASKAAQKKKKIASRPPTLRDIPRLTKELLMQNSKSTTLKEAQEDAIAAAKKLYELCDVGHKSNREIMVASGQYDVIGPLTQCLLHEPIYEDQHHHHSRQQHNNVNGSTHHGASPPPSSSANHVTLLHQQPRIDGDDGVDGVNDIISKRTSHPENGGATPSKPISPPGSTNGEAAAKNDNGGNESTTTENNTPPSPPPTATTISKPTPAPNDNKTNKPTKIQTQQQQQRPVDEKLHFVCLTLNNLSIPHDNKRVMVRERGAKRLIGNLCKIISSGKKEAHLCCIILMNLSFYEPGLTIIGQFSPTPKSSSALDSPSGASTNHNNGQANQTDGSKAKKALQTTTTILKRAADAVTKTRKLTPLENPQSLLRTLQDLVSSGAERGTSDFRWAFGLLANLSRHPENALLIGLTGIPTVAIENLRLSTVPSSEWATNSLEDFSLYFLLHLAEASPQGLNGALEVAFPIMNGNDSCPDQPNENSGRAEDSGNETADNNKSKDTNSSSSSSDDHAHRGGIQSLKATMICAYLGLEWKKFPDHGVIAAGTVSELMGNTFERVGKKQVYTDNDFALRTAVSAYAALAKAAARADSGEMASSSASSKNNGSSSSSPSSCVHTKIMALPTSVALLFQIINAIALHWGEDNSATIGSSSGHGNESYADAYHWDIKAGDLAVGAIMSLLPALLEGTGEDNPKQSSSMATQQACLDLSKIFVFFSKKTNSISGKARSAEIAEKLTESASGSALPLLEASYDLCRNYGRHRVQKNFL
jgi:hypothetical protein